VFRFILTIALALCLGGPAWAAALSTTVATGTTTAVSDTTFTQTFTWSWNVDQNGSGNASFDFSKCKAMTRAFDADITGASTDAKYILYACDAAGVTDRNSCREIGGPYTEHAAVAMGAGMFTKPYGMIYPSVDPTGTDVATVTLSCTVDDYVYDRTTAAWVASDKFNPPDSSRNVEDATLYFNDFLDSTVNYDATNKWTKVDVGSVTAQPSVLDATENGVLRLIGDAADNEGHSLLLGEGTAKGWAFTPEAGRTIYVEFLVAHSDWSDQDWFIGLFEDTASAIIAATGALTGSLEYAGFHYDHDEDASGIPVLTLAGTNNTQVETALSTAIAAPTDAAYYELGIRITGTSGVSWFVNDVLVGSATAASVFSAPLYIGVAEVNGSATANTLDVDYIRASQTR
jgi:hypothetical protein